MQPLSFFCGLLLLFSSNCFKQTIRTRLPSSISTDTLGRNYRKSTTNLKVLPSFALDPLVLPLFKQALAVDVAIAIALSQVPKLPLTKAGLLHATILGTGLWTFLGIEGWSVCVIYFILGSLVTKIKMKEKESQGIAEKRGGARGPENVWGSAAAAMTCAMMTYVFPVYSTLFKVGYVASLATKLSDTFASEIGKAYGKNTYLITTLKMVPKGTEGAISIEGTVAGILGSVIMAAVGIPLGFITTVKGFLACIIAAFVATTAESFIGAVYQDKYPWLSNELVNLINTIIGAVTAVAIMALH